MVTRLGQAMGVNRGIVSPLQPWNIAAKTCHTTCRGANPSPNASIWGSTYGLFDRYRDAVRKGAYIDN